MNKTDWLRDGPLENLLGGGGRGGGGGGAGEVPKKYSQKGKLNEKKFMHANKPLALRGHVTNASFEQ